MNVLIYIYMYGVDVFFLQPFDMRWIAYDGCRITQYSNGRNVPPSYFSLIRMQNSIGPYQYNMLFSFYICLWILSFMLLSKSKAEETFIYYPENGCVILGLWTVQLFSSNPLSLFFSRA